MYSIKEFFEKYKEFEYWAFCHYEDGVQGLEKYHHDKKIQNDASYFRHVRNLLFHTPNRDEHPLIELTDEFKDKFEAFCNKLINNISQIAITYKDIYKREMSDKVLQTIKTMKERSFTHIPIMNGKKVWGVFSESAIFNIVGDGGSSPIDENTQFLNIARYITEYSNTGVFEFAGSDAMIGDIRSLFTNAFEEGRRLDVVFITTTGDKNGDLVGLVTIWDILSV